jgi:hypothetical protein
LRRIDCGLRSCRVFCESAKAIAGSGVTWIARDILVIVSQPLVRMPAEEEWFFPFVPRLSQRFSFQQITKEF